MLRRNMKFLHSSYLMVMTMIFPWISWGIILFFNLSVGGERAGFALFLGSAYAGMLFIAACILALISRWIKNSKVVRIMQVLQLVLCFWLAIYACIHALQR